MSRRIAPLDRGVMRPRKLPLVEHDDSSNGDFSDLPGLFGLGESDLHPALVDFGRRGHPGSFVAPEIVGC